jgi:hypothetical protein
MHVREEDLEHLSVLRTRRTGKVLSALRPVKNEPCGALPVLPLRFLRVLNPTASGGLLSSLLFPLALLSSSAIPSASLRVHLFPLGWLSPVGAGIKVNVRRRRISQCLVRSLPVVAVKPPAKSAPRCQPVAIILQINVLINVTLKTMERLARALEVSTATLVMRAGDPAIRAEVSGCKSPPGDYVEILMVEDNSDDV